MNLSKTTILKNPDHAYEAGVPAKEHLLVNEPERQQMMYSILDTTQAAQASTRFIAGYKILRTIGEGAMGVVLLAERRVHREQRQFAIKIIKTQSASNDSIERFFKEAQAAGAIKHPNIVRILESGYAREENIPYLVMEYFEGEPLKKFLHREGKLLTIAQKLDIFLQIASALEATHACHIVHRDVKPDNIMINSALICKLTDFGIAQLPDSDQTKLLKIMGTPYYLSPEAFLCPQVDARSDLYSLGTIAYELFLGRKPFESTNISSLGYMVQNENPPEPSLLLPELPLEIQRLLERLLHKSPQRRYQSATDLIAAIKDVLQSSPAYSFRQPGSRTSWNTIT